MAIVVYLLLIVALIRLVRWGGVRVTELIHECVSM